jgi:pyrroline-5-carboxylate reductase
MAYRLLLVGCGKMGGALLAGWLDSGLVESCHVVEPNREAASPFAGHASVRFHDSALDLPEELKPEVVVLAVKPQSMDAVLPGYRSFAADAVFLSIAAGKTIGYFERSLAPDAAIVRSMPNTPAAVRRGFTVCCPNRNVAPRQRAACDELLSAVGGVAWVEDEGLLDAVTAVSGGGPAYVFLLIETLAKAGVAAGLPEDLASAMARATVTGSGELARQSSEPASKLRENVTSPGGTTLEALRVLMASEGIQPLFDRAIAAATSRSRELAG